MRIFICWTIIQNQRLFAYANGYDYSSCITLYDMRYCECVSCNAHRKYTHSLTFSSFIRSNWQYLSTTWYFLYLHSQCALHYNLILTPQNIISCVSAPRSKSLYAIRPAVTVWMSVAKGSEYEYGWFILLYLLFGVCYATRCSYVRFAHLIAVNEPILCE